MASIPPVPPKMTLRNYRRMGRWGEGLDSRSLWYLVAVFVIVFCAVTVFLALA